MVIRKLKFEEYASSKKKFTSPSKGPKIKKRDSGQKSLTSTRKLRLRESQTTKKRTNKENFKKSIFEDNRKPSNNRKLPKIPHLDSNTEGGLSQANNEMRVPPNSLFTSSQKKVGSATLVSQNKQFWSKFKDKEDAEYTDSNRYTFKKKKEQLTLSVTQRNSSRPQRVSKVKITSIQATCEVPNNRPKRTTKKPTFLSFDESGKSVSAGFNHFDNYSTSNDYALIKPIKYDTEVEQPIEVNLSLESLLLMTVHSHLYSNEIIGFLAGHHLN